MNEITSVPIKNLTLLRTNPRKITKQQFEKLCKSLKDDPDFFNKKPCLVNNHNGILEVYAGNQRVSAAKKLGWKEVPCIIDENLSDDLMKQRIVKDNKHYGEFDFDILANEWDIEHLLDAGFTSDELSFEDIANVLNSNEKEEEKDHERCPECNQKIKKGK
jgi:ParB-like nuclease domain